MPNSDVISIQAGGKVLSQIPAAGGTATMTPNAPQMPSVHMDMSPNIPDVQASGESSNAGGILGFFYNLGKKSSREIARDKVVDDLNKVLAKGAAGIPLSAQDYITLGAASPTPPGYTPSSVQTVHNVFTEVSPPNIFTSVTQPIAPTLPIPTPSFTPSSLPGVQLPKNMTSCIPAYSDIPGTYVPSYNISDVINAGQKMTTGVPKVPAIPNMGSLLNDNPMKGLYGPGGLLAGGVGAVAAKGGVTKVALALTGAKTVAVAGGTVVGETVVAGTVAGGTVAGGTVAGGAAAVGWWATMIAAAPYVAIIAAAPAITWGVLATYDGIYNPGIGWNPTYEERQAYYAAREAKKAPSIIPQHKPSNDTPTPPGNPNPKKPDKQNKEERAKQIQDRRRWTNKEARERAKELGKGFEEKKDKPLGIKDIAFTDGKKWISPDIDGHNGGVWKEFNLRGDRIGTLDKNLNRIKS